VYSGYGGVLMYGCQFTSGSVLGYAMRALSRGDSHRRLLHARVHRCV